ncbi:MAG TPA: chorismate synthase [bacterium]|nr:chorismate synthase [bacterium]
MSIRFLTAGESHGRALVTIVEGFPGGLTLTEDDINLDLNRRKQGYGRGKRMNIEPERCEIYSGVRNGKTIGSPISVLIMNADWQKNQSSISVPRPGHADLPGSIKYHTSDIRDIWERASARETANRVIAGAIAKRLLKELGIKVLSFTRSIGTVKLEKELNIGEIEDTAELSPVRCPDEETSGKMKELIDKAIKSGDTLGGSFELIAVNIPPGLGTYTHWDKRLDGLIAQAIMSIPSVKGVEIGAGFYSSSNFGSRVLDVIKYDKGHSPWPFYRETNFAGGIEGGMTNGEPIVVRGAVKPVPTLMNPLPSVDLITKEETKASVLRSDVCVVPAAGVIGESMLAWVLADTIIDDFGGSTLEEIKIRFNQYCNYVKAM